MRLELPVRSKSQGYSTAQHPACDSAIAAMIRSSIGNEESEALVARRAFFCGWICLPLLWVVNAFYFREKLQAGELSPATRKWVMLSLTSAGISTALFMLWLVIFQTSWKAWSWSTDIMVSVPDSDLSGW